MASLCKGQFRAPTSFGNRQIRCLGATALTPRCRANQGTGPGLPDGQKDRASRDPKVIRCWARSASESSPKLGSRAVAQLPPAAVSLLVLANALQKLTILVSDCATAPETSSQRFGRQARAGMSASTLIARLRPYLSPNCRHTARRAGSLSTTFWPAEGGPTWSASEVHIARPVPPYLTQALAMPGSTKWTAKRRIRLSCRYPDRFLGNRLAASGGKS